MIKRSFIACCPNCRGVLEFESSWIGQKGQCSYCGFEFIIAKPKILTVRWMLLVGFSLLFLGVVGSAFVALKAFKKDEVVIDANLTDSDHRTSFQKTKDKLVLIDCEDGAGSGFLAEMDGMKYLVTNEHVLRAANGKVPRARLLDGCYLQLGMLEIAKDRDLVRIEVESDVEPFKVEVETPDIGAEIVIYGNSAGGGVVTEVTGKIQGVGPSRIEVDAMFVSGNSGSPVIDINANVIGIATFATYYADKKDWTKKDTRFNDVRRYALRLSSTEWERVEWDLYKDCIEIAHDVGYAWSRLIPYMYAFYRDVDASYLDYNEGCKREYLSDSENESIHCVLVDVAEKYAALNSVKDEYGKLTENRDEFIKALSGEVDDRDKRLYLIDDYDIEVLKKQVALIECLFSFNESKAKAIETLDKRLKEACEISLVQNGDGELDKGLCGLSKEIDILKRELRRCIDKYGNASKFAVNLIEGSGLLGKKDVRLGALLLYDISRTDLDARKRLLDFCKNGKLDTTIEDAGFGNDLKKWMSDEYEKGDKWFGLVAGNLAYEKGDYDKSVKCWSDAKSVNIGALFRLGCFYYRSQECGGAPLSMRSEEKAKQVFQSILDNESIYSHDKIKIEAGYWLGHLLLFANDQSCCDFAAALEIFNHLHDMDHENLDYMFCLGIARQGVMAFESFDLMLTYLSYIDACAKYCSAIEKVEKKRYDDWKKRGDLKFYKKEILQFEIARDAEIFCKKFIAGSSAKFNKMYAEWRDAMIMINKAHEGGCHLAEEYLSRYPIKEDEGWLYFARDFAGSVSWECSKLIEECERRNDIRRRNNIRHRDDFKYRDDIKHRDDDEDDNAMESIKSDVVDRIMRVVRNDCRLRRCAINKVKALEEARELSAVEQCLLRALIEE